MVDNFIDRKHGREEISYPDVQWQHESLKPVLEPTYGIILYQEQVMQIAQVLSDIPSAARTCCVVRWVRKKPEEMAKQRSIFEDGAKKNGIDGELAMKIFDLVEKFAVTDLTNRTPPPTRWSPTRRCGLRRTTRPSLWRR
uniref:DNA polymerase III subunit alpha n=1 Tax=Klebsiella pneumoniae TaxID=573 RepID=A0A8D6PX97_KLEPN